MLNDELIPLKDLIRDITATAVQPGVNTLVKAAEIVQSVCEISDVIRVRWLNAFFSDAGDQGLKRYFNFHQQGIREISDSLYLFAQTDSSETDNRRHLSIINDTICSLIFHIQNHHTGFFEPQLNSPLFWRAQRLQHSIEKLPYVLRQLLASSAEMELKNILQAYFSEIEGLACAGFCSYESIFYFEDLISKMESLINEEPPTSINLNELLIECGFNRLDYFLYQRNLIIGHYTSFNDPDEQVDYLQGKKIELLLLINNPSRRSQTDFPLVTTMLEKWLIEEIEKVANHALKTWPVSGDHPVKKIALNLSVAQIACIIRLLCLCRVIGDPSLTDIFKFVSTHFSSKKQGQISEESLSNQYYAVSQSTARKVLEIIQQLLDKLKDGFFPLLAAISTAYYVS